MAENLSNSPSQFDSDYLSEGNEWRLQGRGRETNFENPAHSPKKIVWLPYMVFSKWKVKLRMESLLYSSIFLINTKPILSVSLQFDVAGDGLISMEAFQVILYKHGLKDEIDPHKLEVLESTIDENTGGTISYQEFVNIVSVICI